MLSEIEKKYIIRFVSGEITAKQFYEKYPENIASDNRYILRKLEEACKEKDADSLTYILYLRGYHRLTEPLETHLEILSKLAKKDWHRDHEYIVDALESLDDDHGVGSIYHIAVNKYDYLKPDEYIDLAVKCVYALSKIGSGRALAKLSELIKIEVVDVAEFSKEELELHRSE